MLKTFLVEDEVVIREMIKKMIPWEQYGFELAGEASDGEMALPLILKSKPDLLITDIKMPFMDGLELAKVVRRTMPWLRIVFLSGHDEFEYAQKAVSLHADAYLLKPVSDESLCDCFSRFLTENSGRSAAVQEKPGDPLGGRKQPQ